MDKLDIRARFAAAKELLALDFDDYAFVGFQLPLFWTKEREKAFCEAIKLNGRRCHVFDGGARPGIRRLESLRKWLRELPKPCGILAAFDGTAEATVGGAPKPKQPKLPEQKKCILLKNRLRRLWVQAWIFLLLTEIWSWT